MKQDFWPLPCDFRFSDFCMFEMCGWVITFSQGFPYVAVSFGGFPRPVGLLAKYPVLFFDFNQTWNVSTDFSKVFVLSFIIFFA
jgi:hypothetical protein